MAPPARRPVECPGTAWSQSALKQETRTGHAPPLRRRPQEQICPVGTGLAGPHRPGHPTPDHHLRHPGRTAPQPPPDAPLRPRPHRRLLQRARAPAPGRGLRRPEDRKTGEPSRGNVGVFRLDKNRERVFNYDWFALVPPTPDEIREAHLAQNPGPSTSAKAREAGKWREPG